MPETPSQEPGSRRPRLSAPVPLAFAAGLAGGAALSGAAGLGPEVAALGVGALIAGTVAVRRMTDTPHAPPPSPGPGAHQPAEPPPEAPVVAATAPPPDPIPPPDGIAPVEPADAPPGPAEVAPEPPAAPSEARDALVDHSSDAVCVHGDDGRVLAASAGAERVLGYPAASLIGRAPLEILHPDDAGRVLQAWQACRASGRPHEVQPVRCRRQDGTWAWVRMRLDVGSGPLQDRVVSATWDVSASRVVEEQLAQAQKMESIGVLTGGIAHDFNNILQAVIGNLQLGMEATGEERQASLEVALGACLRGADLTHRLLSFSRRQPLDPRPVDATAAVAETIHLVRRALGPGIEIATRLSDHLPPALADQAQLGNALVNLALNARDAMPEGGRLVFETSLAVLDEGYVARNPEAIAGEFVMISVTDTGQGIPADVLPRVFEPFFTTKEAGRGTGLGLSMVYGFARQSGGHVKLYSSPDHGTTVRLYLPPAPRASTRDAPAADRPSRLPTGRERVLVVDDDDDVRAFLVEVLGGLGYRVSVARSGPEAIDRAGALPGLDLLVADVVLGAGMDGRRVAQAVRRRFPRCPVLFVSGYTQQIPSEELARQPGCGLLLKPFTREKLAARVRQVLDAHQPRPDAQVTRDPAARIGGAMRPATDDDDRAGPSEG